MKRLGTLNHEVETDIQVIEKDHQISIQNRKSNKSQSKTRDTSEYLRVSNQPAKNYLRARSLSRKQLNILVQVSHYERQIIPYILNREKKYFSNVIDYQFLKKNPNLNSNSRTFLVRHFFKMKAKYKLKRSTIYLATYYMDYYHSRNTNLDPSELLLIALTALFMAMKYEEIYPPQLCQWTNKGRQIITAESKVLHTLNFQLIYETVDDFINILAYQHDIKPEKLTAIRFLSDVCLFDVMTYRVSASDLAQAIVNTILFPNRNDKMELNIKWILERNESMVGWLQHSSEYRNQKLKF